MQFCIEFSTLTYTYTCMGSNGLAYLFNIYFFPSRWVRSPLSACVFVLPGRMGCLHAGGLFVYYIELAHVYVYIRKTNALYAMLLV